jgi:hypothetical protein
MGRLMSVRSGSWFPEPDVTTHAGTMIPETADFFVSPPLEIGRVLSAHSGLQKGRQPAEIWAIIVAATVGLLAGFGMGYGINTLFEVQADIWRNGWTGGLATAGGFTGWAIAQLFSATCSYVAEDGAAAFTCAGRRDNIRRKEILCFKDAIELRTGGERYFTGPFHRETRYEFRWCNRNGWEFFNLAGKHGSEEGSPPERNPYHFARAAERAWSKYALRGAIQALEKSGVVTFRLLGHDSVQLGPGFIELHREVGWRESRQERSTTSNQTRHIHVRRKGSKTKVPDIQSGWSFEHGYYCWEYKTWQTRNYSYWSSRR